MAQTTPLTDDAAIVQIVNRYRNEARDGRVRRMALNRQNRDAAKSFQDWTSKMEGQSCEFIPKTNTSLEQFSAFIKRGLTRFGTWFSAELPRATGIPGQAVVDVLSYYLDNLPDNGANSANAPMTKTSFSTRASDGSKTGLLESLMIFKIHGINIKKPVMVDGKIQMVPSWRLAIDLVAPEDYYPDPLGHGMFEVHRTRMDLWRVIELADEGVYDKAAVDELVSRFDSQGFSTSPDMPSTLTSGGEDLDASDRKNKNEMDRKDNRRIVIIDECWGTLTDSNGRLVMDKAFCAVAQQNILIKKAEPFPFWHGESPFVAIPIIREPFTVWHKSLYDDGAPLNFAYNEIMNLIIDGGISSVWGVKQARPDLLEDPESVSDGIPQKKTLILREDVPNGVKAVETVVTGTIPGEALTVLGLLEKEFNAAVLTNDLQLGQLPQQDVTATGVVQASRAQAAVLDSVLSEMEQKIEQVLQKSWMTILQQAPDFEFIKPDDPAVIALSRMSEDQRFNLFVENHFEVRGLSNTLARTQDLNKLMAVVNLAFQNPVIAQALMQKVSGNRLWQTILTLANVDPRQLELTEEEIAQRESSVAQAAAAAQQQGATSQGGGQSNPVQAQQGTIESQVPQGERVVSAAPMSPSPIQ